MNAASRPWPTALDFDGAARALTITFDDGAAYSISYELLRVESPSAEVQGHGGGDKTLVRDKANVGVVRASAVGNYAVRIVFDDGHDTGIFSWDYLAKLGREHDALMADYRARLAAAS